MRTICTTIIVSCTKVAVNLTWTGPGKINNNVASYADDSIFTSECTKNRHDILCVKNEAVLEKTELAVDNGCASPGVNFTKKAKSSSKACTENPLKSAKKQLSDDTGYNNTVWANN